MSRFRHLRRFTFVAAVLAAAAVVLGVPAATADHTDKSVNPTPYSSRQIPNLGLVKNAIKYYYGDTVVNGEHQASPTSNYAREVGNLEHSIMSYLRNHRHPSSDKPAIVLDVDDTSLLTYNYEAANDFGYNPTINAEYVLGERFPAVFGMNDVATWATSHGFSLFFVTGRPSTQQDATEGNLTKVGYPDFVKVYTKDQTQPYLSSCAPTCTTIQYKSLTRKLIESQGYDIVANVGDQFSDLEGGYSDRSFKVPNPMYYLP
jgi:putative acid phosphatase of HAD superfamily subfamily IIIB